MLDVLAYANDPPQPVPVVKLILEFANRIIFSSLTIRKNNLLCF